MMRLFLPELWKGINVDEYVSEAPLDVKALKVTLYDDEHNKAADDAMDPSP